MVQPVVLKQVGYEASIEDTYYLLDAGDLN
jgi:hypothetical protein